MSDQQPSASASADAITVARFRAEHRCERLVHTRVHKGRCGRKGKVQVGDAWYCYQHVPKS